MSPSIVELLERQPFTRGMSHDRLSMLVAHTTEVAFDEDQIILPAGKPSPHLYLVLTGCVCVEVRTPVYAVCVQVLGPGEAFGWSSLLEHRDTLFQVRALSRVTALSIDARRLLDACQEDPGFGFDLMRRVLQLVAGRVEAVEARLAEFCGIAGAAKPGRGTPGCGPPRPAVKL
jgi:CRP/FNR family cyclic AMP-dependent transcriptional regulator